MFRYRLRSLLIVLALGPPVLAAGWWGWCEWQERRTAAAEAERLDNQVLQFSFGLTR